MRLLKKIAPIAVSALMLASTVGGAVAAGVNDWKTTVSDPVIVLSSADPASTYDIMAALNVANSVGVSSGSTTTTAATVSGNAASLNTASEKIYLEVDTGVGVAVDTLTDNDFPSVLGGTTFTDDSGTEYSYVQTLKMGAREFTLSTSGGDLDDPNLIIDVGTTATTPLYNYTITFTNHVNFTTADSIGEDLEIAGGVYTVGTNTDIDTLHLFGGASTVILDTETAPSSTVTIGDTTYTITLDAVGESTAEAAVTISDGTSTDSDTITEGSSKKLLGLTVYMKDTMSTTNDQGRATILVGANEIYFEDTAEVMVGSDKEDVDKTRVFFGQYTHNMSSLTISVAMQDSDLDHIAVGDKYVDPVWGTFYVQFSDAINGPIIGAQGADANANRHKVEFKKAESACISVEFAVEGITKTIEFDDDGDLEDCDNHAIQIREGQALGEDNFTILNSGSYQMFVELTKLNADDDSVADDDVTLTDVFTGEKYQLENVDLGADGDSQDLVINGQTFTIHCLGSACTNGIAITSSDFYGTEGDTYSTGKTADPGDSAADTVISIYPYLEPIAGLDHRIAFMDNVDVLASIGNATYWDVANDSSDAVRIMLPTGYFDVDVVENVTIQADGAVQSWDCNITITNDDGTAYTTGVDGGGANASIANFSAVEVQVGKMDYIVVFGDETNDSCNITTFEIYPDLNVHDALVSGDTYGYANITNGTTTAVGIAEAIANLSGMDEVEALTQPTVLFVEEEDNSDSDKKHVLVVATNDSSAYEEICYENVSFSGSNVSADVTFDDTDYSGNIDAFGTFYVKDSADDHQELLWFTYPESQMYADVYFAENDAVITPGMGSFTAGGWKYIKDTEVSSFSNRNLVVIGGTAVNRVARKILGLSEGTPVYGSEAAWQDATGVDGANKAIIKLATSPYASDKYALLVAGWEGPETEAAASWLTTGTLPTTDSVLYDTVNKVVIA